MRYLLNYKGTTLPFEADRVKNWLLSSSLRFFFYPAIQKCDIQQCWEIHLSDTLKCPATRKPITLQRTDVNRSNRRKAVTFFFQGGIHWGGISYCVVCSHGAVYEHMWHTYWHKRGQSVAAARGAHRGINLHPAEICEAGRLSGGRWCRLFRGGHLGSMMLSYVLETGCVAGGHRHIKWL